MRLLSAVILSMLFFVGCTSSSKLVGSWSGKDAEPKTYKKLVVMALFPDMKTRVAAEEAVVAQFQAKGIKARVSHDEFPMLGKADELMGMARDSAMIESLKQGFRKKVVDKGADAVLMISAFDVQKTKQYHSGGPSITIAGPAYGYYPNGYYAGAAPYPGSTYYDYYGYHVGTIQSAGYYTTSATYFLESHLYDVATESLIYSAQSKTVDYKNLNEEAARLGGLIVTDILERGVLVPQN